MKTDFEGEKVKNEEFLVCSDKNLKNLKNLTSFLLLLFKERLFVCINNQILL